MHNLLITYSTPLLIVLANLAVVWSDSPNYVVISSTSGYPVSLPENVDHVIIAKKGEDHNKNIYHSNYKAFKENKYQGLDLTDDHIFVKPKKTFDKHSKYDEKVLRKAYNDFIDNKLRLKKRIFTNFVQKIVDKTVDVTAGLTKNAVDFMTNIGINAAANIAKNGAHAVIHKKEEKYDGYYHH